MQPNKVNMNEMDYGRWMKKKWKKKNEWKEIKKKKKKRNKNEAWSMKRGLKEIRWNMNNNEVWTHGNEVKN